MPYYKHLSCLCVTDASGYPTGSGAILNAKLSGSIVVGSQMEPSASGILHTNKQLYTSNAPLFDVQDLSSDSNPNSRYRVFVDTRDFSFTPQAGDIFIVDSGGDSYRYHITSVSTTAS